MGVGIWTLIDKSDYLSLLASSTFAVSAYILILAGALVMVTGFLGCCAVIREQRSCLSTVREPSLGRVTTLGPRLSGYLEGPWVFEMFMLIKGIVFTYYNIS